MRANQRIFEEPKSKETPISYWQKAERQGIVSYSDAYAQCPFCDKITFLGWDMKFCPECGHKMILVKYRTTYI